MENDRTDLTPHADPAETGAVGVLEAAGAEPAEEGAGGGGLCPRFHRAVELIGKRWTGAILRVLQGGRTRFNAIAAAIPEMSDRMLAERLRELEHEAIVARHVVPDTPVRVEYDLTEKGRALDETLCAIARWAEHWGDVGVPGAHAAPTDAPPAPSSPHA